VPKVLERLLDHEWMRLADHDRGRSRHRRSHRRRQYAEAGVVAVMQGREHVGIGRNDIAPAGAARIAVRSLV
jgi:hypothetical protein